MRLKRLELFGFKSFADRTILDFGQTSLTGIVGPNGCGKSNVVDSLRWALGETRPTSMRGSGMTDVIFKGSVSRPMLAVADVTLVLGNEAGVIDGHGPEVSITRRLYKSGEGEYLIDGERVRLKDVKDMLFNTGLGSRGYSVLEQGKIDAVLSANPVQRRAIFEEAAGVSRYKQRRHEAELRLKRVEQDVTRLADVMGELRTRVRSLKIQAGKAERFIEARSAWTEERQRLFRHRLYVSNLELEALRPQLSELQENLDSLRSERDGLEEEMGERDRERSAVALDLDQLSREGARLAGEVRAMEERKSQLELRVGGWKESAAEERARAEALRGDLDEQQGELSTMALEFEQLGGDGAAAKGEAEELGARAHDLGVQYKELRAEAAEQNNVVLARLHERTAAQNRVRHLEESQEPARERLEHVTARSEGMQGAISEARVVVEQGQQSVRALAMQLEQCEGEHASCTERLSASEQSVEGIRAEVAGQELERARLMSRIESLLDREREREGLDVGTRRVLESVERDGVPCSSSSLVGLVADHLDCDTRLARALDVILAERALALVVESPDVAGTIADWLAAEEAGQVGLVVPMGLAQPEERALPGSLADSDGVEGRLLDRVQARDGSEELARYLLRDVVVVDTVERAMELVQAHPTWRFVTPAGQCVDAAGLVGGKRKVTQGAVGRRSSAAELEIELKRVREAILTAEDGLDGEISARDGLRQRMAEINARREEMGRGLSSSEAQLASARQRCGDREAALAVSLQERQRAQAEIDQLSVDLDSATRACADAAHAFERENAALEAKEVERRRFEEEREALMRDEGRARVEVTRLTSELGALDRRIADQTRRVAEMGDEIERTTSRAADFDRSVQQGIGEGEEIVDHVKRLEADREAVDSKLAELRAADKAAAERMEEARSRTDAVRRDLDRKGDQLGEGRLDQQRLELGREEVLQRADEELQLSEEDLRADFDPETEVVQDVDGLEAQVQRLKVQLDKLGPVNTEAVTELEEVGGRLEFLEGQSADLANARRTLTETIDAIEKESKRLFVETFEEVRGNFKRIFRQLFGGGRADVQLEEGADVLDAGIEIIARPPGREMLSIGLLSGGQRTMTALALLFAVFEARPSPFCVLDEVDAALDDANIDRFLGMLDTFRVNTQFIIVTHNKATMAACDTLYGITMQVKGVSHQVSVELDQVDEIVPDTVGPKAPKRSRASSAPELQTDEAVAPAEAAELADEPAGDDVEQGPAAAADGEDQVGVDLDSGERVLEIPRPEHAVHVPQMSAESETGTPS